MHKNAELMFRKYAVPEFVDGDMVLEVGPSTGNTKLRDMLPRGVKYHYADVRNFDIGPGRVAMNGDYKIDSPDKMFDVVFSVNVIEHIRRPWEWMLELSRVAIHMVIIQAPVDYQYHPGPLDCWRMFADGVTELIEYAGFEVKMARHESLDGVHTDTIGIGVK